MYQPKGDNCYKLCRTFHDKKDYIVHIQNLQLYLKLGLRLKRINRGIRFSQSSWLKEWIDLNTNFRKVAENDFEKRLFQINEYRKTMENVRDGIEFKQPLTLNIFKNMYLNLIFIAVKF